MSSYSTGRIREPVRALAKAYKQETTHSVLGTARDPALYGRGSRRKKSLEMAWGREVRLWGRGEVGQLSHHSKESRHYPVGLREPLRGLSTEEK